MKLSLIGGFLVLVFVLFCGACGPSSQPEQETQPSQDTQTQTEKKESPTVVEAQQAGAATVTVSGIDVEKMHLQISSSHPGAIVIPAGIVFSSGETGTQTMMAAKTVTVVFPGSPEETYGTPQIQNLDIEVYCINRMLDAPTAQSTFTAVTGGRELDPVRRLVACMASKEADHYSRQLATWVTSDHFVDMTEDDVREKLRDHSRELINSEKGLEVLRQVMPEMSEEQLREIRENPESKRILLEAASKQVDEEVDGYKTKARALLEQCGFDVSISKFFRGQ